MIFSIPSVITKQEIAKITSSLAEGEFTDGKLTAGWHAKLVKNNQQLSKQTTLGKQLSEQVQSALNRNNLFQTAVRPKSIHSILFSRYDVGMSYDRHVDNALMNNGRMWRTDVSFTIFISSPSEYKGGELVIEGADEEKSYKLEAGSAIIYPATTLHRVNPVTQGTRFVAVGWVQSLVRSASDREILFDLETARRVIFTRDGKTAEFDLISKSIANLLRKWAEV
ncbi:putative enzyme [Hyella patelloides LEGE 07179]|uniref:Putative enzyme n=1 Tax=Hyella patelloides LEGE 07179 TaxID=945734 RepID=A0A563VKL8_9CYAN|nr:Fe2+-dependent dioxygenase [Hyella patelloides]VEP12006.1 putative enzyme [Hyella patelloides LEGE 07179]